MKNNLKKSRYFLLPLMLFAIMVVAGLLSEWILLSNDVKKKDIERISRVYVQKSEKLEKVVDQVTAKLELLPVNFERQLFDLLKEYNNMLDNKELSVVVTRNGEGVYWSDHSVAFIDEILMAPNGLVQLPNGWFVLSHKQVGPYVIHGLVLIKYNYQIRNNYLKNTFAKGFNLPEAYEVLFYSSDFAFPVFDAFNEFEFSIRPTGDLFSGNRLLYLPVILWALAFFFLFMILYRVNSHLFHRYNYLKWLVLLLFLAGVYIFMNHYRIPRSFYMLTLFTPKYFAFSSWWSSLGEFLVFSIFLFVLALNIYRAFPNVSLNELGKLKRIALLMVGLSLVALLFMLVRYLIFLLVMNSSISYAIYQFSHMNAYSLIGFLSIGFLLLALLLFSLRIAQIFRKHIPAVSYSIALFSIAFFLFVFCNSAYPDEKWSLSLFFVLINSMGFFISKRVLIAHRLTVIILYVLVFSFFAMITLIGFIDKSERRMQELMIFNLSEEHDPIAELYLLDIDAKLKNDTILLRLLGSSFQQIPDYLDRKYFSGYFREYDLQVTICEPDDSLIVHPFDDLRSCYPFFDRAIGQAGFSLNDSLNFYFVDNMNGRITYLGRYEWNGSGLPVRIYIELNSKMMSEGTGFPELLLPQHSIENRVRNHFSFAKYNGGELVDRGGDFLYTLNTAAYNLSGNELEVRKWDGYEHYILHHGNQNYIIVSRPNIRINDFIKSFPYVFVFFFLMGMILNFFFQPYWQFINMRKSLRVRVQVAIIGVVLFTLLIVGGGTITFNIWQYRSNHQHDLVDKINSISVEMDMLMSQVDDFSQIDIEYLEHELLRISEVFRIDINLYDLSGKIRATSRPEVFERGLISGFMDNTAIQFLSLYRPTRFVHREHVGQMEYLSAYVPLINRSGKNFGFINIPYFTHERKFRQEIATFVFAFINIYVFLLMASILVAYYVSGRITDPLRLIRENLSKMQLGKSTKPIHYQSDDEIGLLVAEYNNKLNELARSAELLARNEREMAWREMAKQIAHEIKNPLTPMKLNIQFLQRTNADTTDEYKAKVKRVTDTLIEQIDNLSGIASAFSNFAKMPNAQNEVFNLAQRLKEIIDLYENTGQCTISTSIDERKPMKVLADKEQFSRAIINLVRNAIQSIPDDRQGMIHIALKPDGDDGYISITDNGKGIDPGLYDKIFVPNFTTKSSGAGLGLAITKNIVHSFNGQIGFESEQGKGTTFFIRIPVLKQK